MAIVALGTAITLWATGVLTLQQALAGFGDPTIIFIASLFVVAEALDSSGVTAWAGQQLLVGAGESRTRVLVFMLLLVALVTALITVNASVAALLPVVVVMAIRLKWPPSQLLMPLAFGAHAGSLLSLTGTPVNVIISEAAADAGVGAVGFLEFGYAGVPLVIGTIAIVVLLGDRLLPKRNATAISRDFSDHAGTLTAQYGVAVAAGTLMTRTAGVAEVVLPPRSGLVGQKAFPGMVTESGDLVILALQRKGESLAGENVMQVGRHAAAARHVDRARQASGRSRRAGDRPSGAVPTAGGAVRARRWSLGRGPGRDGRAAHHGRRARSDRPRCWLPWRSFCWVC